MDSEDICLSVFLCICVGEGIEFRNKLSVPSRTCESGYVRQNQVDYTRWLLDQRGTERDFVKIRPVEAEPSGCRKRFCQNKSRRYRTIGAQKEILSE